MRDNDHFHHCLFFEASNKGIILVASDHVIFAANIAACRTLRRSQKEIVGSHLEAYLDPSDSNIHPAWEEQRLSGRYVGELRFLRGNETPFPAEVSMISYVNSGEESVGIIFRDISGHWRSGDAVWPNEDDLWQVFVRRLLSALATDISEETVRHSDPPAEHAPGQLPLDSTLTARTLRRVAAKNGGTKPSPTRLELTPGLLLERLTPRETEILYLLSRGESNGQIARRLVISESTVKLHVHRVIHKLEVSDRTQAAIVALRSGLFGPT